MPASWPSMPRPTAQPVWTGKEASRPRATAAMAEIRKADDWGLKASAFELPAAHIAGHPRALADAEIKLAPPC